jgi:hypothetical protein
LRHRCFLAKLHHLERHISGWGSGDCPLRAVKSNYL